ncbi:unnamed protein product [Malus baccata var. baccata]
MSPNYGINVIDRTSDDLSLPLNLETRSFVVSGVLCINTALISSSVTRPPDDDGSVFTGGVPFGGALLLEAGLAYSAAHGYIAEVTSKEEFESCDVTNPIRMFTDGLDSISMDNEGLRYFASSNVESCKKGLKLHVEVMPQSYQAPETSNSHVAESKGSAVVAAEGPKTPSGSAHLTASLMVLSFGLLCYALGI